MQTYFSACVCYICMQDYCPACSGIELDESGGCELCGWTTGDRIPYYIDATHVIWDNIPVWPEKARHMRNLPIWRHHPAYKYYKTFPLSKLNEQMQMPYGAEYECFVCGQQHKVQHAW
jgi:hypothetical protein